jgi:adenosylhomocysteinase
MTLYEKVKQVVERNFTPADYPCLLDQMKRFSEEKPFAGKHLLYAAPLTCNTQVALLPVLAGGAELTVSWPGVFTADPEVVALLQSEGINCYEKVPDALGFDIILDCCGDHADFKSQYGYVELTRSGLDYYQGIKGKTCLNVDSTLVKNAEAILGTGDGLQRAMEAEGYGENLAGKNVLLFGYGKIGQGICRMLLGQQVSMTVVELMPARSPSEQIRWLIADDVENVLSAVADADFIITATGQPNSIQDNYPVQSFLDSKAVLLNMGAVDEYGSEFPDDVIENRKTAFNFILDEPTQMKFIDPVFALFNESAALLLSQSWPEGIRNPPDVLVHSLVDRFCCEQGYERKEFLV